MSSSVLIAIGSVVAASIVLQLLNRASRRGAIPLDDGGGDRLVYPQSLKVIGYVGLLGSIALLGFAAYALWQSATWAAANTGGAAAFVIVMCLVCGGFGWLSLYLINKGRTYFDLTATGLTERRGSYCLCMPWADIVQVRVTWAGTRLVVCNAKGERIKLDRTLVGISTLTQYLQRHLPANVASIMVSLQW